MTPKVIVNPAAGQGASGKAWPAIEARLRAALGEIDVGMTAQAGDEFALARQALADGHEHFIAVGGDGTMNGVLNGIMGDGAVAHDGVRLSVIPAGTSNEMARALGVHGDQAGAIENIASGREQFIDLLQADCASIEGGQRRHYGVLAISWGGAAEIVHRTNNSRFLKKIGGRLSYYVNTLVVTLTYPNRKCDLIIDDRPMNDVLHYSGLICNLEFLGGGMRLAPGADHADGLADFLFFKDIARRDIILQKPSWLFEGRHIEHPKVDFVRGRTFAVKGSPEALIDADGETIGRLPLSVKTLKQALRVIG
ncbi:MAG: diacylglycerol kinase family lipid kinase [Alphaproteobacteria bacterium]|nr:diacylglycerol kinase family lipid kinase [Alphaproteobacteria bacterium]MDP6830786.1 diacylglycerol kinase family lipid kinase [Alphaproteobacteria bacterium]MDP6872032.1 diacylglycerol kinase family lipid kinase [Alphaproteobacteria bacterium]